MTLIPASLRLASTLACLMIAASFAMWVADKGEVASQEQVARVAGEAPLVPPAPVTGEAARELRHDGPQEAVNDVADVLVQPFTGVTASAPNDWVRHAIPVLLALLTYGLLMRLLINYMPTARR